MSADTKITITAKTDQAENALRSLGHSVDDASRHMFSLGEAAGSLAGALSLATFTNWIKSGIDVSDQLYKLSQKTGTAVEDLAGLKFAADQNGASLEVVANAAKKLTAQLVDKPEIFSKLGITAKDSTGALVQLADIFALMPDGVEKTALSVKLMGKNGEEIIPFLNNGSAALQELIDKGKTYNPVTADSALAAQQFNDSLDALKSRGGAMAVTIANELLPKLNETITAFSELNQSGSNFLPVGRGIGVVFETLVVLGANVGYVFRQVGNEIGGITAQMVELFTGDWIHGNSNFVKIGQLMKEDAAAARREIDAFSGRIINGSGIKSVADARLAQNDKGHSLLDEYRTPAAAKAGTDDFESFRKRLLVDLAPAQDGRQSRADRLQVELNLDKTITAVERDKLQVLINQLRVQDAALLARKSEREGQQVLIGLEKDFYNELEKRRDALNSTLLSASQKILADDLRTVSKRAQDSRIELEKLQVAGTLSATDLNKLLQQVTADEQAQKDALKSLRAEQDRMNESWIYGADVALRTYMDEIVNVARHSESMVTKSFRGMEDALVNFVKTGKLDFRSLADSIISDLIRMQIQKNIMTPLTAAMDSAGMFGGIGGLLGDIFGGGSSMAGATQPMSAADVLVAAALPGYAAGIDYVPRDMIAQIHKGERITTAVDNKQGYGGNITVNVTGSNSDQVRRAAGQGAREALVAFNRAGRYA